MKVNMKNKKLFEKLNLIQQTRDANLMFEQKVLYVLQENEIYLPEDVMESILSEINGKKIDKRVLEELMINTFGPKMRGYEKQLKEYLSGNID